MKASILTIAAAISVAVVAFAGAAEAGGCGGKGGYGRAYGYSPSHVRMSYNPSYARQQAAAEARREAIAAKRREATEQRRIAARLAEKERVAKLAAEPTENDQTTADAKTAAKPVTTAALDVPTPAARPVTTATTAESNGATPTKSANVQKRDVACKRFVPAAGLTITVPCGT